MLKGKRSKGILRASEKELEIYEHGKKTDSVPLTWDEEMESEIRNVVHILKARKQWILIIPDGWVEERWIKFQSNKPQYVETFARRIIKREFHNELSDFFHWFIQVSEGGENGFCLSFIHEERFLRLWKTLKKEEVPIVWITTLGLLMRDWLAVKGVLDTPNGVILVVDVGTHSSVYAFSGKRVAFQRKLVPSKKDSAKARLEFLAYEIEQSAFFFTQKEKRPVERIDIFAPRPGTELVPYLEARGDWAVSPIETAFDEEQVTPDSEITIALFLMKQLVKKRDVTDLAPISEKRARLLRPWLDFGILTGVIAVVMLIAILFHAGWPTGMAYKTQSDALTASYKKALQDIGEWDQKARILKEIAKRKIPSVLLMQISSAIDSLVSLEEVSVRMGQITQVKIHAVTDETEPTRVERILRLLRKRLSVLDPGLSKRPLDTFSLEPINDQGVPKGYRLTVELAVPWL